MKCRIENESLLPYIETAEKAAVYIKDGMTVAMSGYAMAGYPKGVVEELVRRKQSGEELSINLVTGANVSWLDEKLSTEEIISRRVPMCVSKTLSSQINKGNVHYVEQQMVKMPRLLRNGSFGKIDVAVVEAIAITKDGLIPTTSIGLVSYLMDAADKIIIEINKAQPEKLIDLHDIYIPLAPPDTRPIPLWQTNQRIGNPYIPFDISKIKYIVETNIPERTEGVPLKSTQQTLMVTENLFRFLEQEYRTDADGALPPIQIGLGNIAKAIAEALKESDLNDLKFFCGGVSEPVLELVASGKASAISTGGLEMSERVEEIINTTPEIHKKLVLRNGDITNNAEIIGRLGLLALNTGIEVDIYGNVNSSHISGNRVVNGIGGGASFAQNAGLSVILMTSSSKCGAISNIVPMVAHQDICEHDVDIIITENGVADVRGLDEIERANEIILNCADKTYRDQLLAYLNKAIDSVGGHHPQLPEDAFAWYRWLKETGTMLEER